MIQALTIAYDLLTFVLLPLCMCLQPILQTILNLVFGPRKQDIQPDSAIVHHVLINLKMHYAWPNGTDKFLIKFKKVVDTSVIEQADVFLSGVTAKEFHFIRTEPGINVTDMDKYPLVYFTLYDHAIELITIPHETVYRYLRGKPGRDGGNITLLHNIGRCGSTLVAHMVYKTGQCQVLSEPFPLLESIVLTNKLHGSQLNDGENNLDMLKATLLLLCKIPEERYFIKVTGIFTGNSVQLIHRVLPGTKDLFLYRALVPTLTSFNRILGRIYFPTMGLDATFDALPTKYRRIWEKIKVSGLHERFFFILLSQMHPYYLESLDRNNMKSYSYESLLKDKEGFCKSLLSEIGIGEEWVPLALSALKKDSQENTPISRKNGAGITGPMISREALSWTKRIGKEEFGMEIEEEDCRVTNVPFSWTEHSHRNG